MEWVVGYLRLLEELKVCHHDRFPKPVFYVSRFSKLESRCWTEAGEVEMRNTYSFVALGPHNRGLPHCYLAKMRAAEFSQ